MVSRNDPCPCGSGKKYKKCCGKEQVVDLQAVINSELEGIQLGFIDEGLEPADYFEMEQRGRKWMHALSMLFDKELVETIALESFLFIDKPANWKSYLARQKKRHNRQRIVDVLTSWEEPFFLLGKIEGTENGKLSLRDSVSDKRYLFPGDGQGEPGEWLFGIVLPSLLKDEIELQPTSGIIYIPQHQKKLAEALKAKLKSGFSDSLELYRLFTEKTEMPQLPEFEARVLELVKKFTEEFDLENELITGMAFAFLLEASVNARKPEGVAAGILQAVNEFGFFKNLYVTQKTLAAYFNTSTASLTKYRDIMHSYLTEKIKTMSQEFEESKDAGMPQILVSLGTDPRITERSMWQMVMYTQHSEAASMEEINQLMKDTMNVPYTPVDDAEAAQLTSYKAYESRTEKERQQLAKQAFKLDSENIDANLLMAENTLDPSQKRLHYLQAIETGYRQFEPDVNPESTWGYVLNRPLLRALFVYGAWLMAQKDYTAAIKQLEKLMKLNPDDQQGASWLLASAYIRAGKWTKAEDFMVEFPSTDYTALDFYIDTVMDIHDGTLNSQELKELKTDALEWNPHVPALIKKGSNPGEFPRFLSLESGNEDEAKLIYWLIYDMPGIKNFT